MLRIKDINEQFTRKVARYLELGYRFSLSMNGHQGERMKVDLENDTETVRIRLESCNEFWAGGLELIVETYDTVTYNYMDTLWSGKGTEIYRKRFYSINQYRYNEVEVFTDSEDEINRILELRKARSAAKKSSRKLDTYLDTRKARSIIYKWAKRQEGCKTIKPTNISKVEKRITDKGAMYTVDVTRKSGIRRLTMR